MGRVFRLLPQAKEKRDPWSSREWSRERRGWLFLTSTPQTREWLSPLTSFWLDLLVMRLMNQGMAGARPVWFVLDDLATLRKLPQLQTAILENRKSNNRFVLGVQSLSQLEESYGNTVKGMLSQAATKVFLRTTEAESANWISETIGDVEIERLQPQESGTKWYQWRRRRWEIDQFDRQTKRLVTASEIMGLAPRQGYLKSEDRVVRLSFSFDPAATKTACVRGTKDRTVAQGATANFRSSREQQPRSRRTTITGNGNATCAETGCCQQQAETVFRVSAPPAVQILPGVNKPYHSAAGLRPYSVK